MMKGLVVVLLIPMVLGIACSGGCLNQQPSQGRHITYLLQHDETSADQ